MIVIPPRGMVVIMKRILILVAVLPLLALAACGGSTDHNDADVEFSQQMIPHHQQAIMMADLVPGSDASADVVELAAQIKAAQAPEITLMRGWLKDWDETVMGDHGMGDMDDSDEMDMGDGMLNGAAMRDLARTSGAEFDRLWLTGMIGHHEGAITMAETELADGKNPASKMLARAIITAQEKEIATMKGLLE